MNFYNRSSKFLFGTLFAILILIIFIISYANFHGTQGDSFTPNAETICIDVEGYVLGAISPNASVYLYRVSTLDLESVLKTVRTDLPYQVTPVNHTKGFKFLCLFPGQYIVSIHAVDYLNRTIGSPLPYEMVTDSFSVSAVFQGGDHEYLLGGFNISGP